MLDGRLKKKRCYIVCGYLKKRACVYRLESFKLYLTFYRKQTMNNNSNNYLRTFILRHMNFDISSMIIMQRKLAKR